MSRPHCIVCGKQIRKKMVTLTFSLATANGRQNHHREGHTVYLDPELRPKTKEDCHRFTNHEIVRIETDHNGRVWNIVWWEGDYQDEFFDTGRCAQKQGYASARSGQRFTWSSS